MQVRIVTCYAQGSTESSHRSDLQRRRSVGGVGSVCATLLKQRQDGVTSPLACQKSVWQWSLNLSNVRETTMHACCRFKYVYELKNGQYRASISKKQGETVNIGQYADAREAAKAVDVTMVFLVCLDDAYISEAPHSVSCCTTRQPHNQYVKRAL